MKNRIISLLLCISIILSMLAATAPRAKAVVPLGLGAAVVFSFLWSAGIELWRDGAGQDQTPQEALDSAIRDLWDEFHSSHGSAPSLDRLEGEITFDEFGRAIIKNNIALTLNDFVKWFRDTYEATPGSTIALTDESSPGDSYLFTLPQSEAQNLPGYDSVWALPVTGIPAGEVRVEFASLPRKSYVTIYPLNGFMYRLTNDEGIIYFCSTSPFERVDGNLDNEGNITSENRTQATQVTLNGMSRPNDGNNFVYYASQASYVSRYGPSFTPYIPANGYQYIGSNTSSRTAIEYVILTGDVVGSSSDLFANIGLTVLDNVYDTLQDQAIAIDIGLTGTEEEEDEAYVGAAANAFVGGKDAALGYSAVATPVPVEGVQELYPTIDDIVTDVEGLEVPSLGHALATRFPFCIPFDVNYLFKSLSASPKRPVFEIDVIPQTLKTKIGITQNTAFTLDFGDQRYALLLKIIRWGCLFGFILWLALITKRLIWTTGG